MAIVVQSLKFPSSLSPHYSLLSLRLRGYPVHPNRYRPTDIARWKILTNHLSLDSVFKNISLCYMQRHDCRWNVTAKNCFSFIFFIFIFI